MAGFGVLAGWPSPRGGLFSTRTHARTRTRAPTRAHTRAHTGPGGGDRPRSAQGAPRRGLGRSRRWGRGRPAICPRPLLPGVGSWMSNGWPAGRRSPRAHDPAGDPARGAPRRLPRCRGSCNRRGRAPAQGAAVGHFPRGGRGRARLARRSRAERVQRVRRARRPSPPAPGPGGGGAGVGSESQTERRGLGGKRRGEDQGRGIMARAAGLGPRAGRSPRARDEGPPQAPRAGPGPSGPSRARARTGRAGAPGSERLLGLRRSRRRRASTSAVIGVTKKRAGIGHSTEAQS